MQQDQKNQVKDDETCWWVRYLYKRDLLREPRDTAHRGNAFFYAGDEEGARQKVESWLHQSKHDDVVIESIEPVPYGFHLQFVPGLLQELPENVVVLPSEQVEQLLSQDGFHLQFVPGLLQELPENAVVLEAGQVEQMLSQEEEDVQQMAGFGNPF